MQVPFVIFLCHKCTCIFGATNRFGSDARVFRSALSGRALFAGYDALSLEVGWFSFRSNLEDNEE